MLLILLFLVGVFLGFYSLAGSAIALYILLKQGLSYWACALLAFFIWPWYLPDILKGRI